MHRLATPLIIALAATAGTTSAQLTLPPTAPKPERPEYIPPSERVQQPPEAPTNQFNPTSVEYTSIYTVNDDGTITGPTKHFEIAALKNNPLIDEELWEFLDVILEERSEEMEVVAHKYPRQCIDAITTLIPKFDVEDEATRTSLANVTSSLTQPTGLISWVQTQGVLTDEMVQMSQFIANDYTQTMMMNIKNNAPKDLTELEVISLQARFLVRGGIDEPLRGFGRLARFVIENNPGLVENADEILALQGNEFIDDAAKALSPIEDQKLQQLFLEAHNNN
ncbi:MAG: hypothetical protein ED559_00110 [Phycisphaera sp.]|nr:MAG: hypothetical protein ED559_00110 [Phycisphaera sp.]